MSGLAFPFPFHDCKAPLTARGFVRFVNLRPERGHGDWVCDECCERVTIARQERHARNHPARP